MITFGLQEFHPGARIDEDGHYLSDILDFVHYKGGTNTGDTYPSYDVDITEENIDSSTFSGLSIALDTDLSDVKVSFSFPYGTSKNVYGNSTSYSQDPTARTEDVYNANTRIYPTPKVLEKNVYVFYT